MIWKVPCKMYPYFSRCLLVFFWFIIMAPNFFHGARLKAIWVDFTEYPLNQFSGFRSNGHLCNNSMITRLEHWKIFPCFRSHVENFSVRSFHKSAFKNMEILIDFIVYLIWIPILLTRNPTVFNKVQFSLIYDFLSCMRKPSGNRYEKWKTAFMKKLFHCIFICL